MTVTRKTEEAAVPIEETPNYHRIEVTLAPSLGGEVNFHGVCDAPVGTICRLWCNESDCEDGGNGNHDNHELFDQGSCGYIESLNGDPSYIPEMYTGPEVPLHSGHIDLSADMDGVTWEYSHLTYAYSSEDTPQIAHRWFYQSGGSWMAVTDTESVRDWFADTDYTFQPWMVRAITDIPVGTRHWRDSKGQGHTLELKFPPEHVTGVTLTVAHQPLSSLERGELEEYRRRDAAGWTEYAVHTPEAPDGDPEEHKNLSLPSAIHLRNFAKKRGFPLAEVVQRQHPAPAPWAPATGPKCEPKCGHQCGECRLGLGVHRSCDPRCDHHLPAQI